MQYQWVKMKITFRIFQDRLDIWRLWKVITNIMNIQLQKDAKMKISSLQVLRPLNYLLRLNRLINKHRLMCHRSLNHLIFLHNLNLHLYLQNLNHHTFHLFRHILINSVPSSSKANNLIMSLKNKERNLNFSKVYQIKIFQYKDGLKLPQKQFDMKKQTVTQLKTKIIKCYSDL